MKSKSIFLINRPVLLFVLALFFASIPFCGIKVTSQAKLVYTTNAKVNAAAEEIIDRCTDDHMSRSEKIRACYLYLVKHMRYSYSTGPTRIRTSGRKIRKVHRYAKVMGKKGKLRYSSAFRGRYGNVLSMQGTCYGQSMVFCILANHLGYAAHMCHGKYVSNNGRRSDHYWCYLVMNNKKRYFDVQIANYFYHHGHKGLVDNYYKKSKRSRTWRSHHSG